MNNTVYTIGCMGIVNSLMLLKTAHLRNDKTQIIISSVLGGFHIGCMVASFIYFRKSYKDS